MVGMPSNVPVQALITYGVFTASMISLWIQPFSCRRLRSPFWAVLLLLAIMCGLGFGFLTPAALASIFALGAAVYLTARENIPIPIRWLAAVAVLGLALGMMLHAAPGFKNFKVLDAVKISPDATPFTKYLNFDKPLIGLFILGFGHPLIRTWEEWRRMFREAGSLIPIILLGVLLLAFAFGFVRVDAKWPSFWWVWVWTNLFFTCIAEEALFRGFIQRHREDFFSCYAWGWIPALGSAALLFGLIHFAGGIRYVVLATAAGVGYGYVYQRTQRIEAGILAHFSLNFVHFVFFTYPALARGS